MLILEPPSFGLLRTAEMKMRKARVARPVTSRYFNFVCGVVKCGEANRSVGMIT